MNETVRILSGLAGGLALFLFGMNSMSDALQKAAGEKMRQVLSFLTQNPVMGALAGALVTAVLQSSSATTVMVIGFVSAGLMTLPQGISVIFGANIGTTMTAQLMAFKISNYIYPIIFVGFMMNFAGKKERVKNIGMVLFSFGLLFEGIEIMGSVMKPLASAPFFTNLMATVSHIPVLGILLGAGMTLIVQSSSATIAVLQNFASQAGPDGVTSAIGLAGAIPILLGDNIGTTITALLACIGQSKNAKRTAIAHSVFNITGSILFALIIPAFAGFVTFISPRGPELEVISRQIANAHTVFNIACTLIWLPLLPIMVKIVKMIIPGEDMATSESAPKYIDDNVLSQPVVAMYLDSEEIKRCSVMTIELLNSARTAVVNPSKTNRENYKTAYNNVRSLQNAISQYTLHLFSNGGLTEQQSDQTSGFLFISNSIDRISDRCNEVITINERLIEKGFHLSEEALRELDKCFEICIEMFHQAILSIEKGHGGDQAQFLAAQAEMRKAQKTYRRAHMLRVEKKLCDASVTGDFSAMLDGLDRIVTNCMGIAEEAEEHLQFMNLPITGITPATGLD